MLCWRRISAIGTPAAPCFRISTIWLSVNRDFRMGISLAPESLRSKCLPKGEAYGRTFGEPSAFQAVSLRGRLRDRDHRTPPAHLAGREQPAVRALQRARLPVHRRQRAALPAHARSLRRRGERAPGAARGDPLMAGSPEIVANGARVVYSSRCLV